MKSVVCLVLAAGVWLGAAGCAVNPIVGTNITTAQRYFGDVGLQGHGQNVTILKGSRVTKLSIIGNNNTVTVEDGASVYRIEFWGNGNTVIVPENMWILRTNTVGTNQVVRRPSAVPPIPAPETAPAEYLAPPPVAEEQPVAPPQQVKPAPTAAEEAGPESFLPEDK